MLIFLIFINCNGDNIVMDVFLFFKYSLFKKYPRYLCFPYTNNKNIDLYNNLIFYR